MIAVVHRLSTLRNFDRILVLRDGQIVEDDEPEYLMQIEGPYRSLIQKEDRRLTRRAA